MKWKDLKNKTWIDWIKIIVAIDIAGAGLGLILGIEWHVFAGMLGFVSKIIFGVLYVFVAVLIFKRVFPREFIDEDMHDAEETDKDINHTATSFKNSVQTFAQKTAEFTDKIYEKIDDALDKSEDFLQKRTQEVKDEIKKITRE